MKKLLLIATLGVAGLMSANNSEIKLSICADKNEELFVKDVKVSIGVPHDWVPVVTGCGKVFFLDNNMYGDCYECLQEDARKFTDAQCGKDVSFEVPF